MSPVWTLEEDKPGEESARDLYLNYGFKNIKVITAGDTEEIRSRKMNWISEIIGKHQEYQYFNDI